MDNPHLHGHPVQRDAQDALPARRRGRPEAVGTSAPLQDRIFQVLIEHPYGLKRTELIDIVYGDRADGGPNFPQAGIAAAIFKLNKRFKKQGLWLRVRGRGTWGLITQIWIERPGSRTPRVPQLVRRPDAPGHQEGHCRPGR